MKTLLLAVLSLCLSLGLCHADSPIPGHPAPPELSLVEAIELFSDYLEKDPAWRGYYLSKIELVEASMMPPPRGSARHWIVVGRKHREEKAKELVLFLAMDGMISATPPARNDPEGEPVDEAREVPK